MLFNSYEFILYFLPAVLIIFVLLGSVRLREVSFLWLVAASIFFYGWWDPHYISLLLISVVLNFLIGRHLSGSTSKGLLILGITANLAALGYFKYSYFFIVNVGQVFDQSWHIQKVVLPLAISFFTFQQIAYLTDCYRRETEEHSFLQYCLFVTFFPQLIAGPIVHHKEMLSQFTSARLRKYDFDLCAAGISLFSIGLAKKVLIADNLATYATPVFAAADSGSLVTFADAWTGALAYSFQLYFDFSGYADMAIGAGMLFGIRLPTNFNSPYTALSIQDFWQRWHITLSRFLKEYLYIPLGGNRHGKLRRYINLIITMLLGGLWHGAGWNFIIWGALHGLYLTVNHMFSKPLARVDLGVPGRFIYCGLTFLSVVLAWVFFRAETFNGALTILSSMFSPITFPAAGGLDKTLLMLLFLSALITWCCPNSQKIVGYLETDRRLIGISWQPDVKSFAAITVLFLAALLQLTSVSEFLYFQF